MLISALLLVPITCIPVITKFFSLAPLTGTEWAIVFVLSISPLFVVEFFKLIRRNMKSNLS